MRNTIGSFVVLLAVVALAGCGGGGSTTGNDVPADVAVDDSGGSDTAPPDGDTGSDAAEDVAVPDDGGADDAATATSITVVMGGDIAEQGRTQYARAIAAMMVVHVPAITALILAGDNARYEGSGGLLNFYQAYYAPPAEADFGQFDDIAFPAPGNHEYMEAHAQGYFDYFATRMNAIAALDGYDGFVNVVGQGYYSFDLGGWHFVSLNGNCAQVTGGCGAGSAQETWLAADLAAHAAMPIIATWHAPRYACGGDHTDYTTIQPLWADLYDAGADFVFNGHNHYYQRWVPLDKTSPQAVADPAHGLTEIVAGSYGVTPVTVCTTVDPRVAVQIGGEPSMGVFFLTLSTDGSYSWEYRLESDGSLFDSGSGVSHHAP